MILPARFVALLAAAMVSADTPVELGLATDDDIRATFVGRAACPPQPWPVGVGPHEFRADGAYARQRDLAAAHGRYAIAQGRICVTLADSERADFCLAVLKGADGYLFRLDDAPPAASRHAPLPVVPCAPPVP